MASLPRLFWQALPLEPKDPISDGNLSSIQVLTHLTRRRKRTTRLTHRVKIRNNWDERIEVRLDCELPSPDCPYVHGGNTRNRIWVIREKLDGLKGSKDHWQSKREIVGRLELVQEVMIKPRIRLSPDLGGPWIECKPQSILCRTGRDVA